MRVRTSSSSSFLPAAEMGDSLTAVELGTDRYALKVKCGKEHTCALLVTVPLLSRKCTNWCE